MSTNSDFFKDIKNSDFTFIMVVTEKLYFEA